MILFLKRSALLIGVLMAQAKYKYNAWKKAVDEGTTPESAQSQYVDLIKKFKDQYGFKK